MARTVFLLSPAHCGGKRAGFLLNPRADFPLAVKLRRSGATLGEVFSFLSGLYFRGKLAYAGAFRARKADALVITPGRGLVAPERRVTLKDLVAIAEVGVSLEEPRYIAPLERDAATLASRLDADGRVVLLGSIATGKYVDVLERAFNGRLHFPSEFVGRGDMSRGGLMLRCVLERRELNYVPLAGAVRHGRRPPRLAPLARRVSMLAALTLALAAAQARALPLFSRQYGMACTQCHSVAPRLNDYGMRFFQNGNRPPGEAPVPLRMRDVPVSMIGLVGAHWTRSQSPTSASFTSGPQPRPDGVALESAGALARHLSFHLEAAVPQQSGTIESGRTSLQLDDIVANGALNLQVGRFDVDPPFLAEARRLTFTNYLSPVSLDARGLELNGAHAAWTYAGGLVESQRKQIAGEQPLRTFKGLQDIYLDITRRIGSQQFAGRMLWDRQDTDISRLKWLQHLQAHGSLLLHAGRVDLMPGYTLDRFDDRPAPGIHDRHQYGLLEAVAPLDRDARWVITARIEHELHTRTSLTPLDDHDQEVLNLSLAMTSNARSAVEWSHHGDNVGGPRMDELNAFVFLSY